MASPFRLDLSQQFTTYSMTAQDELWQYHSLAARFIYKRAGGSLRSDDASFEQLVTRPFRVLSAINRWRDQTCFTS